MEIKTIVFIQTLLAILGKRKTIQMKTLIILIISFSPLLTLGQETKEITVQFPNSKQVRESYFVLKSNPEMKNGKYIRYYKTSSDNKNTLSIKEQGKYENGLKEGKWMYYKHPSNNTQGKTTSIEFYKNGLKTGIWENYHYETDGTVIERFDFDLETKLEPIIKVHLTYPLVAKEKGIQGEVVLNYLQKTDCSIENIEIIQSLDSDCDKEAIQSLLKMNKLIKKYSLRKCEQKIETKTYEFRMR